MKRTLKGVLVVVMLAAMVLGMTAYAQEDMTIELYDWEYSDMTGDETILKAINEKYGVNVKFTGSWPTEDELKQKYVLEIVSGEIPDIMSGFGDTTFEYYNRFVEQGVLAEIPVEEILEYAPAYYQWVVKHGGEDIWNTYKRNGKNYSLPVYWTLGNTMYVIGYRGDLFAQAGYDELPSTLDELEAALIAVKDAVGIAPVTAASGSKKLDGLSFVYGAFGVCPTIFHEDENGEIVFGGITEGAREAVELLNRWYVSGLIDVEFPVNKQDNMIEKWSEGTAALVVDSWWEFLPEQAFFSALYYNSLENSPEQQAAIKIAAPPAGENGKSGFQMRNPGFDSGMLFGKQLEGTEKLKKILQIINDLDFTQEGLDYCNYGEAGVTYDPDEHGLPIWKEPYTTEEARKAYGCDGRFSVFIDAFNDYDLQAKYMTAPEYQALRAETEAKAYGKYDPLVLTYRPVYNQYAETLDQINLASHIDFITGAKPLSEWDDFVQNWLSSGGEEALKEAEANWAMIR